MSYPAFRTETTPGFFPSAASENFYSWLKPLYIARAGTSSAQSGAGAANRESTLTKIGSIRFADQYGRDDCGSNINAADADLGRLPGEIWVNQACGLDWKTPIKLSQGHALRILPGNYILTTVLAANTAIYGTPATMATSTTPLVQLMVANGANPSQAILADGQYITLRDFVLDGNRANNPKGGPNISTTSAALGAFRLNIENVTSQNSPSHGLLLNGTASPTIYHLMSVQNALDGLSCVGNAGGGGDGFVADSEFETNGKSGLELKDCAAWRIIHDDFGQNGASGGAALLIHGIANVGSWVNIISLNQFANNYENDLEIEGYNGGVSSYANIVTSNQFDGGVFKKVNNRYSKLALIDGGNNVISGNILLPSSTPNKEKYGISITETAPGRALPNQVALNLLPPTSFWGTAPYFDNTVNGSMGSQFPVEGAATSCQPTLDLYDVTSGASNLHKYLSVGGGNFVIRDSACKIVLLKLTDSGTFSVAGQLASTINTGTPPLSVTSKTSVPNLAIHNCPGCALEHERVAGCTTAGSQFANCDVTVRWKHAFADTAYSVSCTGEGVLKGLPMIQGYSISTTKSAESVSVRTISLSAAAAQFESIACQALHD